MKRKILLYAALGIFTLASCSKNNPDTSVSSSQSVESALTTGSWRVTNFNVQGQDHTIMLNEFRLVFVNTGYVQASNDLFTESGNWSLTTHNNLPAIMLNMPSQHGLQGFQEVSGDYWDITVHDNNTIEMRRMIQDSPTTDYLTIKRIQ
jgi:hypothetical protein